MGGETVQKWSKRVSKKNTSTEENELFEGESLQGWTVQSLTHGTAALGRCVQKGDTSWHEDCLRAVVMRTNRFLGGGGGYRN